MVIAKIFVEGGGDANLLRTNCRKGFSNFLKKAGLEGFMPRIVACGGREATFNSFCTAIKNGENAFLLVDSEEPVKAEYQNGSPETWKPFSHLQERDKWDKPQNADETHCHLMTQCMETWLIADRNALAKYFSKHFNANALPALGTDLEAKTKSDIYDILRRATSRCNKHYDKGDNSFEILETIDPAIVTSQCAWAKRFVDILKVKLKELSR